MRRPKPYSPPGSVGSASTRFSLDKRPSFRRAGVVIASTRSRLTTPPWNSASFQLTRSRAEDRNEPGSSGQRDGARIDRYFIRVTDCGSNTLLFLSQGSVSGDLNDDTPIVITNGNLQLHITSCAP